MTYLIPLIVQLPVLAVVVGAVEIDVPQTLDLTSISGNLQALTSGSFMVEVRRDSDSSLLGSLTWTRTGPPDKIATDRLRIAGGDRIRFDVTSVGVGAVGCYVTIWAETV